MARAMATANDFCKTPNLGLLERGPAPILFVATGPLLAGVIKHPLRDILPERALAIEADRVGGLNFHRALATAAGDAQYVTLDVRETSLPHLGTVRIGARIREYRFPILGRERSIFSGMGVLPGGLRS